MGKFWLKLWIGIKVTAFSLVFLYVLVFVLKNHGNSAKVWVWLNDEIPTTTLMVAFFSFLGGVIVTLLVRTTMTTIRQVRELSERQRHEKMQRDVADMKAKAAMLRPRPQAEEIEPV